METKRLLILLFAISTFFPLSFVEGITSERCYVVNIEKQGKAYTILSIEEKTGRITYDTENHYADFDYGVLLSDRGEPLAYFPIGGLEVLSCSSRIINGKLGGGCYVKDSGGITLYIPKLANGTKVKIIKQRAVALTFELP